MNFRQILFVYLMLLSKSIAVFHYGRVKPGKFEYPKLNGRMSVLQAVEKCQQDLACGGFTFKGSYGCKKVDFEMYFFHVVILNSNQHSTMISSLKTFIQKFEYLSLKYSYLQDVLENDIRKEAHYYHWSTYEVERDYIHITHLKVKSEPQHSIQISDKYNHIDIKNVGTDIKVWTENDIVARDVSSGCTFSKIDFDDLESADIKKDGLIINLKLKHKVRHTFLPIDRCCRRNGRKLSYNNFDNIMRIPCNLSANDFLHDYVESREPVILMGCQEGWKAKNWTFGNLLGRYVSKWPISYYHDETDNCFAGDLEGPKIYNLMKNKVNVKSVTQLPKSMRIQLDESQREYLKLDLLDEYDYPAPFPKDQFEELNIMVDQAYIMFSTSKTGTGMHVDPLFTDAFNALVKGEKWWVSMPKDLYEFSEEFTCSKTCSERIAPVVNYNNDIKLWYLHMLPQLRNRIFYGQHLKTFLQTSGETLYMPNLILHSVWNMSPTISFGNNPLFKTSFVEHLGFGGLGKSRTIRQKIKIINDSEVDKVSEQINAAIRSHHILNYSPPKIWNGYDSRCLKDVQHQSKRAMN